MGIKYQFNITQLMCLELLKFVVVVFNNVTYAREVTTSLSGCRLLFCYNNQKFFWTLSGRFLWMLSHSFFYFCLTLRTKCNLFKEPCHTTQQTLSIGCKSQSVDVLQGRITLCTGIHAKHINAPCGQYIELLNVKPDDMYSNHQVLNV